MKTLLPQKRRLNADPFDSNKVSTPPDSYGLEKKLKRQKVQNESPTSLGKESTEYDNLNDSSGRNQQSQVNSQEIMPAQTENELRILKSVREVIQKEKAFPKSLYQKKQHIQINQLQTLKETKPHVSENKLSDKFTRRDVSLFNHYSAQNQSQLSEEFPKDIDYKEIYGDLEHTNFADLTNDKDYLKSAFGKTIAVKLVRQPDGTVKRIINEDKTKAADINTHKQRQAKDMVGEDDPDINRLRCQMKTVMEDFNIDVEKVANMWITFSGDISQIRKSLQGKKVVSWTYLEDLALEKDEDSEEFQVLLRTKGRQEIENRKKFLLFDEET